MINEEVLELMLMNLIDKRNKLAYTIVKCRDEGYNINNRKANLFYLINIVLDCCYLAPHLSDVQQNKLINITRKLLIL